MARKYSPFEEMEALLEMIEPTPEELAKDPNASHGAVSYRTAKEFYYFAKEYVAILKTFKDDSDIVKEFEKEYNL